MEESYAFFHQGNLLTITRESGERKVRYSMRVKFISERVNKYDLHMLEEYSRVYADMVLFGAEYPDRVTDVLGSMINLSKAEEELPDQNEDLANVLNNLPYATIESHDSTSIKFDSGQRIEIAEIESGYFHSDPNIDLVGSVVTEVAFEKSSETGEKMGITMTLDSGGDPVSVKSCSETICIEPADVVVTILPDEGGVFIKASPEEFVMPNPPESPEEAPESPQEEYGVPTLTQIVSPRISPGGPQSPRLVIIEDDSDAQPPVTQENLPEIKPVESQDVQPPVTQENLPEIKPVEGQEVHPDAQPPVTQENLPEATPIEQQISQPSSNACKFLGRDLPQPSRHLIMSRFDTDLMRGALIEFNENILRGLFDAYDVGVFGGELGKAIREGKLQIEMKWGEDKDGEPSVLSSADISGNLFTLVLSKTILSKMVGNRKGKHEIFGMPCATQFEVIMILVESFCVIVAIELCEMGDRYVEHARKLFGHEGSEQKIAPPDGELRLRLQELLRLRELKPEAERTPIMVTLNDGKQYEVAGARGLTEVLLNDGKDKKRVSYNDVTHINGQPL